LATLGLLRRRGALGRLLIAWFVVMVFGVVVGIVRQSFPPHRVIAFGFCLPILAAYGLEAVGSHLRRARLPMMIAVCTVLAASATITWLHAPRPFNAPTVTAAQQAGAALTATAPRTPVIVDLPNRGPGTVTAVLRAANVLRAEVGSEHVRDVLVRFPRPDANDPETLALWVDAEQRSADAVTSVTSVVEIRVGGVTPAVVPPVPNAVTVDVPTGGSASRTSPADVAMATVAGLLVLGFAGAGWARAAGASGVEIVERAPVTGMGALILAAVVADRFGVRLGRPVDAGIIVTLVAAGGYLVASRVGRSGAPESPLPADRRAGTTAFVRGRHPSLDTPSTA
jgi:hypothetical protein